MSKHTPGPWMVHIEKNPQVWEYTIRSVKPHNPAGGLGVHIATVNPYLRQGYDGDSAAAPNADLIARAWLIPELMEKLQNLHDACEFWEDQDDPVLKEAREVLEKASLVTENVTRGVDNSEESS